MILDPFVKNREVSQHLYQISELLELQAENKYKVIAYQKAARSIESLKEDVEQVCREGLLQDIPGVGKAIAEKIEEYLWTGRIKAFDDILSRTPKGLAELLQLSGMGPKTISMLHETLNITSIDELEKAAKEHRIRRLPRMGPTSEKNILKAIERYRRRSTRIPLYAAEPIVDEILSRLKELEGLGNITDAGSYRRRKETVGDIDILATSAKPADLISAFVRMPMVEEVLGKGPTKATVIVKGAVQVDLRIVEPRSYGTVLQYFTGSKDHNVKLRSVALDKGYSLSEYSLKRLADGQELFYPSEEEVYTALDMDYIPPEIREDTGEIETALDHRLPKLLELKDIKGDLHIHSTWADGRSSVEEMARNAKSLGYEYIAICDHSPSIGLTGGLSQERLEQKIDAIAATNEGLEGITVLSGTEMDIRADGTLDYSDDLLARCDVVVASLHMAQQQKERTITGRLISAIENRNVDIIAHPTGRIIGKREPYEMDMAAVLEAAARNGTAMEINAHPNRLDLNDRWARTAKEMGIKLSIGSDAHQAAHMTVMRYGVDVARRGWLEKGDVLNAMGLQELLRRLGRL